MKIRILLLVAIFGSALAREALATTLIRLSLDQLSQASTAIVRGRVLNQVSQWNSEHTRISTLTTIAVENILKGTLPSVLVIQQPGGTVGNFHVHVAATVHFQPQRSYILFLEPSEADPSKHLVVGMLQGAFPIYRDATTGEERVIRPFGGLFEARRASAQTLSLQEFRQQISAALAAPIAIPAGTSLPVVIQSTEFSGVGRVQVRSKTARDVFPNPTVVIPAGSALEGTGEMVSGKWVIHWTSLSIRGRRVPISAISEEPGVEALRGRMVLATVR